VRGRLGEERRQSECRDKAQQRRPPRQASQSPQTGVAVRAQIAVSHTGNYNKALVKSPPRLP
jgi:hypothetical protein